MSVVVAVVGYRDSEDAVSRQWRSLGSRPAPSPGAAACNDDPTVIYAVLRLTLSEQKYVPTTFLSPTHLRLQKHRLRPNSRPFAFNGDMSLTGPRLRQLHATITRRPKLDTSADDDTLPAPAPNTSSDFSSDDLKKPPDDDECNKPMDFGRRDPSFWVALLFIVAPVYLVTPISWAYTLYTARRLYLSRYNDVLPLSSSLAVWEWALFAYCVFESAFSIYYQSLARYARAYKSRVPQRDMHELQLIFTRVLQSGLAPSLAPGARPRPQSPAEPLVSLKYDDPRASDYRNHFRLWFWGAPWKDITRESMRRWLSWAVFDKPLPMLDNMQKINIEEATIMMEKRAGGRLREDPPEGKDHIEPVGLTWDPVNVWSRPGILYVIGELMNRSAKWYLEWKYNMVEREYEGIGYLIRDPSPEQTPTESPLVLMHGLGFGVAQYLLGVLLLLRHIPSDRPILIPLQPNISHAIFHPTHVVPLTRDQWVNGLKLLFEKLRWDEEGVTMVSHSKGSLIHTWMLKAYPELIKRSCFVDPGRPRSVLLFMGGGPCLELCVPITHERGKDAVIDAGRVRRYLTNHGVHENLYWDPNGKHGQPVLDKKGLKALKDWLLASEPNRAARPSDSSESSEWSESEDEVLDCIIPYQRRR
ncbi:hypothetical protein M407DRAFT_4250 [Tulasnella calospora MUT 4182]|uniref:AB hydrolase-1 domain-containing protein n=1 Tax=Tulasnella calospora MUT 4182 TaxID=1051891 RepID=A0A0C3MG94_9AGAM|nr:hypothetical protein M407DRAFT_4250 [Tulasnella calospora MUT 4182]